MYTPPIKGKSLKKSVKVPSPYPNPMQDIGAISNLVDELRALRQDIIDTADSELEKIDVKIEEIDSKLKEVDQSVKEIKLTEKGEDGKDADEQAIADYVISQTKDWVHSQIIPQIKQPKDGVSPNPEEVAKLALKYIRQPNEDEIFRRLAKKLPKPSLKVIREELQLDKEAFLEEILKSPKLKIKLDGINTTLERLDRRYIHGGGDTVGAGTGISIANVNGTKVISSTAGGVIYSDTVSGTIDGVNQVFTVANDIDTAIALCLANSIYQPGVDFTVTGLKEITMTVAPDSSLSGQPFWLSHN